MHACIDMIKGTVVKNKIKRCSITVKEVAHFALSEMPVSLVQPAGCHGVACFSSAAHGLAAKCPQGLFHASEKKKYMCMTSLLLAWQYYI